MLEKELVPQLRFSEFDGEWEKKELNDLGKVVNGLTYSPNDIDDNGVLVLRSSNVQNNQLSFLDNVFVITDHYNKVLEDDILICVRNGSKRLIGKNALITKETAGVAFGAFMSVYRSKYNIFIYQLFATETYQRTIYKNLGATINSINNGEIKKIKFYFPSPPEQKKIATFLT
jgi:type I restriction enzyme S subunit